MVSANIDQIKQNVDISIFSSVEEIKIVVFCLMIIKNSNNLVLELGPFAFDCFVEDKKK
jgi:hypothetical protein